MPGPALMTMCETSEVLVSANSPITVQRSVDCECTAFATSPINFIHSSPPTEKAFFSDPAAIRINHLLDADPLAGSGALRTRGLQFIPETWATEPHAV